MERFKKVLIKQAPCAKIGVMTLGSRGSCLVIIGDDDDLKDDSLILEPGHGSTSTPDSPAVFQRHGALWCDSFRNCDVVDTTGAGDAYQGGFLTAIWGYSM